MHFASAIKSSGSLDPSSPPFLTTVSAPLSRPSSARSPAGKTSVPAGQAAMTCVLHRSLPFRVRQTPHALQDTIRSLTSWLRDCRPIRPAQGSAARRSAARPHADDITRRDAARRHRQKHTTVAVFGISASAGRCERVHDRHRARRATAQLDCAVVNDQPAWPTTSSTMPRNRSSCSATPTSTCWKRHVAWWSLTSTLPAVQ